MSKSYDINRRIFDVQGGASFSQKMLSNRLNMDILRRSQCRSDSPWSWNTLSLWLRKPSGLSGQKKWFRLFSESKSSIITHFLEKVAAVNNDFFGNFLEEEYSEQLIRTN